MSDRDEILKRNMAALSNRRDEGAEDDWDGVQDVASSTGMAGYIPSEDEMEQVHQPVGGAGMVGNSN